MNILNKQIDSIYDRQKNLYSKYPHYSQQNAESKKVCEQEKITATSGKDVLGITKGPSDRHPHPLRRRRIPAHPARLPHREVKIQTRADTRPGADHKCPRLPSHPSLAGTSFSEWM